MNRRDETRIAGVVAERLAELPYGHVENRVRDERVRPDGVEQLAFGDDLLGPIHQASKHQERLRPHGRALAVAPDAFGDQIDTQGTVRCATRQGARF